MANDRFTPIQRCMLEVLADGEAHTREELHGCLADDLGSLSNIQAHLSMLRRGLRPKNQDIRCEFLAGKVFYRLVNAVAHAGTG